MFFFYTIIRGIRRCIPLLVLICVSCTRPWWVYTVDIPQGNILDSTQIARLELGMSPEQVAFVLGFPLLIDSFHPYRWDYIYLIDQQDGSPISEKKGFVLFADGKLQAIHMDAFATENVSTTTVQPAR